MNDLLMQHHVYLLLGFDVGSVQFYGPYNAEDREAINADKRKFTKLLRPSTITEAQFQGSNLIRFEQQ